MELAKRITALPVHQQECVAAFVRGWKEQEKRAGALPTTPAGLRRAVAEHVGYYEKANGTVMPLKNDLN